jgi:protein TonB
MPVPANQLTLPQFIPARIEPPIARGPEPPAGPTLPTSGDRPRINFNEFVPLPEIPMGTLESDPSFSGDPDGVPGGFPSWMAGGPLPTRPEPEPESEPEPILIIGSIRPPQKITHVNPVYPAIAARARVQGTVKLQAVIDASGRVADLTVIQSIPLLDRAAIEAVQQWRYQPTILNGRAVPVIMTVEVVFQLR